MQNTKHTHNYENKVLPVDLILNQPNPAYILTIKSVKCVSILFTARNFTFHNRQGISRLAGQLSTPQNVYSIPVQLQLFLHCITTSIQTT